MRIKSIVLCSITLLYTLFWIGCPNPEDVPKKQLITGPTPDSGYSETESIGTTLAHISVEYLGVDSISSSQRLCVGLFNEATEYLKNYYLTESSGEVSFSTGVIDGDYKIIAFVDLDGNSIPSPDEPYEFYRDESSAEQASIISVSADNTYDITITFNDNFIIGGDEYIEEYGEQATAKLIVNVEYTGAVSIDATHRIYIDIFDTDLPAMYPRQSIASDTGTVTLENFGIFQITLFADADGSAGESENDPFVIYDGTDNVPNATLVSVGTADTIPITVSFNDDYTY